MDYPAGYLSDEYDDEFDGFMSDGSSHSDHIQNWNNDDEVSEQTQEQKLLNMYYNILHGNVTGLISLIDSGLSVNALLQGSWKPIVLAASIGNCEIVHELIARGADVNDHKDNHTVLMSVCKCPENTASFESSFNIVEELLQHGANADAITRKRETALMFAASTGNVPVIRRLLSCCNVFAEDNRGWNALFWAVSNDQTEATRVLYDAGLESQKADVCGNTPLHYATMQENEDITKILSPPEEDTWNETVKTSYDLQAEFKDGSVRPIFLQDVYNMLYGMKCGNLQKLFESVSLLEFLSMDEENLQNVGVHLPFQRNKIQAGLYKFHKHLFKQKSIPVIPKTSLFSTVDVSHSILTAVRQLTVMEASLKYILKLDCNFNIQSNEDVQHSIAVIKNKITRLKRSASALDSLAEQWDGSNKPVDLISREHGFRWFKVIVGSSVLVGLFLVHKFRAM